MDALRLPCVALLVALGLTVSAGCSDDDDAPTPQNEAKPVAGTFVGKVAETEAFVSVVAAPAEKGRDKRDVTVFVCDARRACGLFSGSMTGNEFVAKASKGDGEAKGRVRAKAATGTIVLPGGEEAKFTADQATATTGLYDLTVERGGKLRGVSAAGVALTGSSSLPRAGEGSLKLADGRRLKFEIARSSAGTAGLPAGEARLIVLPSGQLRGAAQVRGDSGFFIRSAK